MNCPSCRKTLRRIAYEGMGIHTCDGCGGEWINPEAMAHIVRVREALLPAEVLEATRATEPVSGVPMESRARSLTCPECREGSGQTRAVNFGVDTGIIVDRCTTCAGVWLEHNELEKVQALLERWEAVAPARIREAAKDLAATQRRAAALTSASFRGSRFAFVNALVNRLLDAA